MKGDYYWYIAEYSYGDQLKKAVENTLKAYSSSFELAKANLYSTDLVRLELALSYSLFYYEMIKDPKKAFQLANEAFNQAVADIGMVGEDVYKETTNLMQLIRDNIILWIPLVSDEDN